MRGFLRGLGVNYNLKEVMVYFFALMQKSIQGKKLQLREKLLIYSYVIATL